MNVLFIINTPGGSERENTYALVPFEALGLKMAALDAMHNKMVNADYDIPNRVSNNITSLYKRFGIERQEPMSEQEIKAYKKDNPQWTPPKQVPVDLEQYVAAVTPFQVDKIVCIGWAV